MKALTLWQPWATLIVEGLKPREFRSWPAPAGIVGQRLVIHAAKRPMRAGELRNIMDYIASAAGVRDGIDARAHDLLEKVWRREADLPMAAGLGTALLGTPSLALHQQGAGPDTYAWPMLDVEKWAAPVPAKGAQGFWEWKA